MLSNEIPKYNRPFYLFSTIFMQLEFNYHSSPNGLQINPDLS